MDRSISLACCVWLVACAGHDGQAPSRHADAGSAQTNAETDRTREPSAGARAGSADRDAATSAGSVAAGAQRDAGTPIDAAPYRVGAAKVDITGPFVGSSTGYNSPGEELSGLGMRLYARAFVVQDPNTSQLVALVSAEMIHMYQSVKLGVIKKLRSDGYAMFSADNVLLSATHTHAAPSNISWYTLFNLFNGVVGFDPIHYQLVVDGIAQAIERAHDAQKPAQIKLAQGQVSDAAFNRSLPAYQANRDAAAFSSDVDQTMTLLRFDALDGSAIGAINWFGVHGTSLGIDNRRAHGDNKGYAAYAFEQAKGAGFVAAFAQGSFGDVSPNQPDAQDRSAPFKRPSDLDPALDRSEDPIIHGRRQFERALSLYESARDPLPVALAYRHTHVTFNHIDVKQDAAGPLMAWDVAGPQSTCPALIGGGFLAGDEEGAPVALAEEGVIRNRYVQDGAGYRFEKYSFLELNGVEAALGLLWPLAVLTLGTDQYDACQKEKFALLPVGEVSQFWLFNPDVPLVPVHLPLQLVKLGPLALAALPFEVSTMSGRRIAKGVADSLHGVAQQVVIAGMANAYGQYLTTREEYAAQHFEGAFTTYGPFQEAASTQEMKRIADDLAAGRASDPGIEPPDLSDEQVVLTPIADQGVPDDSPGARSFGTPIRDAAASYARTRDTVEVAFQGAHPRSVQVLKAQGKLASYYANDAHSYLAVERKTDAGFVRVADDGDPYTAFDWKAAAAPDTGSEASVRWLVRDQPAGSYRITYFGLAKSGDSYRAFSGSSREFALR
jgi:neutral ceramidase